LGVTLDQSPVSRQLKLLRRLPSTARAGRQEKHTMETNYIHEDIPRGVPLKMWTRGVPVEDEAKRQLMNAARLPIVFKHIAAMPDVHFGIGATVGSVIPTLRAITPAAVGVDIGCGMIACKTTLAAEDLPDNLAPLRSAIERAVPHGRSPGARDPGAWQKAPGSVNTAWAQLEPEFTELCRDYPKIAKTNHIQHLGTLGTGNHFIEVCLDEQKFVWFMLHSGSRGVGNFIGTMFIELAKQDAMRNQANLPDRDLAYFEEGARYFGDYVRAVGWAQKFAAINREVMMKRVIEAAKTVIHKNFQAHIEAVNCHPQLRAEGTPLRRRRVRHAQGRGEC
jgi:tRNA-splicing ligase RtcB (3'-phosphate/5'-hydroxy nucleic acid ligase)